jgi:hypothetical protein
MRAFTLVCASLMVLTACTSAPTKKQPSSILDVLEQSKQQSVTGEGQYAEGSPRKCPVGTVDMCVAETRAGLRTNCACVDSSAARVMLGGSRY